MIEEKELKTEDNVKIVVNCYKNGFNEVVIILPGWCMTKDSKAFKQISESFACKYDVLTLDFRGHGKSGGFYTFTTKEIYDVDAVVNFAREYGYSKMYLTGFSLGGALSIIYTAEKGGIDKAVAISAPSDFAKIENQMWRKEAWGETFKKFELKRFCSIRPYPFILDKIKPIEVVKKIKVPTLFIAGEKDPTVFAWHTETLYNEAECKKQYKCFKTGIHAEDLYLNFKEEFMETCFNFLVN